MKKLGKIICLSVLAVVVLTAAVVGAVLLYDAGYQLPEQAAHYENTTGLVQAYGRTLYDAQGEHLRLHGINVGQLMVQEGWMSPFDLEPLKNEDGSYVKDGNGNILYEDFNEEHFRRALVSNPNLSGYDPQTLIALYRSCFFTEEDFRIIAQELGMNSIRLSVYWREFLNEDLTRREEAQAFSYLDWFISKAGEHGLYVILDLHGAPGSQNGDFHSGAMEPKAQLWHHEPYIQATVDLWCFISEHYTHTQPQLGKWIATYDLLNEPVYEYNGKTTQECWQVMDRIYEAIRENGDRHVITMQGCWDFTSLPDPAQYGWENVQYEYHWYNWQPDLLPNNVYHAFQNLSNMGRDYDVPVLIGEFTCFEDKEAWAKELAMFDKRGYSWMIWSYKTTVTGWWTSSWGIYTCQLNLDTAAEQTKCNIATCTYEEFLKACEAVRTENCVKDTLYDVLCTYFECQRMSEVLSN